MAGSGPPPTQKAWEPADIVAWALVAVLGLLGLFVASRAKDLEMSVFGFSLAGFAAVFLFFELKRFFDQGDAARAKAKGGHQ